MRATTTDFEQVLDFWFGVLDSDSHADAAHSSRWWRADEAFDKTIQHTFGSLHAAVSRGEHVDWLETPRGRLAIIIVLDQFSRNIYRDTPQMYASDAMALTIALEGIDANMDTALPSGMRAFFYMPLMHSEDRAIQDRSVDLFSTLGANLKWAKHHRDIVHRFGRFPHRNRILGRTSTPEEIAFIASE
jgi:uncharacterized protein (DUF924 family)